MSEAISSTSASSISSDSAECGSALVNFSTDAAAPGFTDAPPSAWAFAAHEAAFDGEAIDAMHEPESARVMPLVAVATFVIAEAELYADAEDALVAMTPTPFAFGVAGIGSGADADLGMVMWNGESSENDSTDGPIAVYARGETGLALHDVGSHGISLDWTDTILG